MTSEKKPSIYYDRGSIGSSEELDEYGVWVKSEPQEMYGSEELSGFAERDLSEPANVDELPDLELPAMDDLAEAAELSAKTSPSGDEMWDDFPAGGEEENADLSFDNEFEIADSRDEEENGMELPPVEEPDGEEAETEEDGLDLDFDDLTGVDIELEDENSRIAEKELEELGFTEVDMDVFSEAPAEEAVLEDEPATELPDEADLDELVLDDTAPDFSIDESLTGFAPDENFEDPLDLVDSLIIDESNEDSFIEDKKASPNEIDLSTQLLMKIAEELSSIRTELSTLKKEMTVLRTEPSQENASQGFFNEPEDDEKIALTGDEMDNILNTEGTDGDDTEAVSDLDMEISGEDIGLSEEKPVEEAQGRGFFDDEEDETIALTGDELNNILNTADFTEETGADAGGETAIEEGAEEAEKEDSDFEITLEESDLDGLGGEIELDGEIFTEESGVSGEPEEFLIEETPVELEESPIELEETPVEASPEEDGIELLEEISADELTIDEASIEEISEETSLFVEGEGENISLLQEKGAHPMTAAPEPEDASFLEEDPLALTGFEEETLDLSEAIIDEPDLSSEIQDNPVTEPSLDDISIDLELDEDSLSLPAGEDEEFRFDTEEEIEIQLDDEEDIPLSPEADDELPYATGSDIPSDDDLALLPEGFVVEADDTKAGGTDNETGFPGETENFSANEADIIPPEEEPSLDTEEAPDAESGTETVPDNDDAISGDIPSPLKHELKTVLSYMDQLLESLPDEKIEEFARSEYFDTYKKLFKELGLV